MIIKAQTRPTSFLWGVLAVSIVLAVVALILALALRDTDDGHVVLPDGTTSNPFQATCRQKVESHKTALWEGRYIQPILRVLGWEAVGRPRTKTLSESAFALALERGDVRMAMVEGRGGLGKSKLADALEAYLCEEIPVFQLDARDNLSPLIANGPLPGDAIEALIIQAAGFQPDSDERDDLIEHLGKHRWVLLVDSLDEVAFDRRRAVVESLRKLQNRYSGKLATVVFARPPLFSGHFGLARNEVWLAIEPLRCNATHERIRTALREHGRIRAFVDFVGRMGLDRRAQAMDPCFYTHMATYRDIGVVLAIARDASFGSLGDDFDPNRASIYHRYILGLLKPVTWGTGDPARLLDLVRAMVDSQASIGGRIPAFKVDDCENALGRPSDDSDARALCVRLLDSRLFKPHQRHNIFGFRNQSVTDWFLADRADRKLADHRVGPWCSSIGDLNNLFESSEVAAFLVGMKYGRRCVAELILALCQKGCPAEGIAALVDQGLPRDFDRESLSSIRVARDPNATGPGCFETIAGLLKTRPGMQLEFGEEL